MAQQHPTAVPDGLALEPEPQPGTGAAGANGAAAGAVTRPYDAGLPPEPDVAPLHQPVGVQHEGVAGGELRRRLGARAGRVAQPQRCRASAPQELGVPGADQERRITDALGRHVKKDE